MSILKRLFNKKIVVLMLMLTLSTTGILSGCELSDMFGEDAKETINISAVSYVDGAEDVVGISGSVEINYSNIQEGYANESIEVETTAHLHAETNEDYEFVGWYSHDPIVLITTEEVYQVEITKDIIINYYAHFVEIINEFTVTFEVGNVSNTIDSIVVEDGNSVGEAMPAAPAREDYIFIEWNTTADGIGSEFTAQTIVVADEIVYAIWEEIIYYSVGVRAITDGVISDENIVTINYSGNMDGYDYATLETQTTVNIGAISIPEFVFSYWSTSSNGSVIISMLPNYAFTLTSNTTYYAIFESTTFTVTFEDNEGSGTTPTSVTVNSSETLNELMPQNPMREGYTFVGWETQGGSVFTNVTVIEEDMLVQAIWEEIIYYTVTVRAIADGIISNENTVKINYSSNYDGYDYATLETQTTVNIGAISIPEFVFSYWSTSSDGSVIISMLPNYAFTLTSNTTYYAIFETATFTVNFEDNEGYGVTPTAITVNSGETLNELMPQNPMREGYTFVGWETQGGSVFTNVTVIEADLTVQAIWEMEFYNVTAIAGTGGFVMGSYTFNYGDTASVVSAPDEGYEFVSWTVDGYVVSTQSDYSFTVTGDVTLVANFEIIIVNYLVEVRAITNGTYTEDNSVAINNSYNMDGFDSMMIAENTSVTVEAIASEGFIFISWVTSPMGGLIVSLNPTYTFSLMASNTYCYAMFESISLHTIDFDVQGQSASVDSVISYYGTSLGEAMPVNPFGMFTTFDEWNSEPNGNGFTFDSTTIVDGDLRVYAIWIPDIYDIEFNSQGGSEVATIQIVVNNDVGEAMPLPPTRDGYLFIEWNFSPDGTGGILTPAYMPWSNGLVYAIWEETPEFFLIETYAFTDGAFSDIGGTVCIDGSPNMDEYDSAVFEEDSIIDITATSKAGYVFIGWYTSHEGGTLITTNNTDTVVVIGGETRYARFETAIPTYTVVVSAYDSMTYDPYSGVVFINDLNEDEIDGYELQALEIGTMVTLTAIPSMEFFFSGWYDMNHVLISSSSSYSFELTGDINYYASFIFDPEEGPM